MGREIRRVPRGWKHPEFQPWEGEGYRPLYNTDYEARCQKWWEECKAWEEGRDPHRATSGVRWFWEWEGGPPKKEDYVSYDVNGELPCYQLYETVTEGTPVSPVFDSLAELEAWLVTQGHTPQQAAAFCRDGWAPTMAISNRGVMATGVDVPHALDEADKKARDEKQ